MAIIKCYTTSVMLHLNWRTFGHETIKHILDLQLQIGKFAHAYLFIGPEAVGKKVLAEEFAKKILKSEKLFGHPDFSLIDPADNYALEGIQTFLATLNTKPLFGKYRVAIVNNIQRMNPQSINAMLKTIEEPSSSVIFILISSTSHLLPTIVSRCQLMTFSPCSLKQLQEYISSRKLIVPEKIVNLSFGRVGRLHWLLDGGIVNTTSDLEEFENLSRASKAGRLLRISRLSDESEVRLEEILTLWTLWQEQKLIKEPNLFVSVRKLAEALTALKKNQNKKLILQQVMLAL